LHTFAENKVDLGTTLLVEIKDFKINHPKFIVIIGKLPPDVAFVCIDSKINPNIFHNDYLKKQLVPIDYNSHKSFLQYDSYVDCSNLHYKPETEILHYIISNPNRVHNVSDSVFQKVVETITYSKLISVAEKRRIGFA
jgi:hypothetical protein